MSSRVRLVAGSALVRAVALSPRPLVARVAAQYVAGSSAADALNVVRSLNATRRAATIDVLGECLADEAAAAATEEAYVTLLDAIGRERLDANVSVKPTALGLRLGKDIWRRRLRRLVCLAAEWGNFVRIDMEDSTTTTETLDAFVALRRAGYKSVGVVLQARLHRTLDDIEKLASYRPNVRLCKGIYLEPPTVSLHDRERIRERYVMAFERLLTIGSYVALATHDEVLVEHALARLGVDGIGADRYEFQMLLGVRDDLTRRLVADGHRVRVYVPYGERWYEYALRRLQENPAVAVAVSRNTLRRAIRPRLRMFQ
jgi:proline dehydrogenase